MFKPIFQETTEEYLKMLENAQNETTNQKSNIADVLGLETIVNIKSNNREKHSLKHFEVDLDVYDSTVTQSPKIMDNIEMGTAEYKGFADLNTDLFLSLYKYQPYVYAKETMQDGYRFNNELTRQMVQSEAYDRLRNATSLNELTSIIGTEVLSTEVLAIIQRYKEENEQKMEQLNNFLNDQNALNNIQGQIETIQNMANQNNGQLPQALQDLLNQMQQQQQQLQQNISSGAPDVNNIMPNLAGQIAQAVDAAADEAEEVNDIMNSWLAGSDPGQLQRIPYEQKKDFIEKVRRSEKLKDMAKLVGRFKATAIEEQKRKTREYGHTIEDVKIGNKIEKVLPSEKMKLNNDITKLDFHKRYNEKQLLEYETIDTTKKEQGPIIVAIDTSGSMEGDREAWSKAVAVALLEIASIQKRNFAVTFFSTKAYGTMEIEKGKATPAQILDIAETFNGGGTTIQKPLEECLKILNKSKFKKADVVLISDGEDSLDKSFISKFKTNKEDKEFRLITVAVGHELNNDLKSISDEVHYIYDLALDSTDVNKLNHELFSAI